MNKEIHPMGPAPTRSVNPKVFTMWLFIVSILMLFAAFTSAYLVRKAEGNWVEFKLPNLFWISTGLYLLDVNVVKNWKIRVKALTFFYYKPLKAKIKAFLLSVFTVICGLYVIIDLRLERA